jgi:dihydroorotase
LQQVLVDSGRSSWSRFEEVISSAPARLAGLRDQGSLSVGAVANITLIDPSAQREIVSKTHSRSSNNPFAGMKLPGEIVMTIYRGRFTVKDRELVSL